MIETLAREHQQELAEAGTLLDLEALTCQIGDMVTMAFVARWPSTSRAIFAGVVAGLFFPLAALLTRLRHREIVCPYRQDS